MLRLLPLIARPWLLFSRPLRLEALHPNPMVEFARWYKLALRRVWLEFPDAVCLSTLDPKGFADSRMVLLKDFDNRGLTFFTNFNSAKGNQLTFNNQACMTFFWDEFQRQIRVQGFTERISEQESDAYFKSRSRQSQISACASNQSEVMEESLSLERRYQEISEKFKGLEIPRPPEWGGFRLIPQKIEFWKARPHRLHDRFRYSLNDAGDWVIERLYP